MVVTGTMAKAVFKHENILDTECNECNERALFSGSKSLCREQGQPP